MRWSSRGEREGHGAKMKQIPFVFVFLFLFFFPFVFHGSFDAYTTVLDSSLEYWEERTEGPARHPSVRMRV